MSKARARELTGLPLRDGLRFGGWSAWLIDPHDDLLLIRPAEGWVARVALGSNGWFDFREADGSWHTVYSNNDIEPDDGNEFEGRFGELRTRPTGGDWPEGEYESREWRFEVTADRVRVFHGANDGPLVLHRDRPLWTWNKKPLVAPAV